MRRKERPRKLSTIFSELFFLAFFLDTLHFVTKKGETMHLRPGTALLPHDTSVLQVGGDSSHHLMIEGLNPCNEQWLETLTQGQAPDNKLPGRDLGVEKLLHTHGFFVGESFRFPPLRFSGVDPIVIRALELLIPFGLRRFHFEDSGFVDSELADCLGLRYVGTQRAKSGKEYVESLSPTVVCSRLENPSLVVVSTSRVFDHMRNGQLLSEDQDHLLVCAGEQSVTIGPLVIPGRTPCSRCLTLAHNSTFSFPPSDEALRRLAPSSLPSVTQHVSALELARVISAYAGITTLGVSAFHSLTPPVSPIVTIGPTGSVSVRYLSPHSECGCSGFARPVAPLTAVPSAEAASR